MLRILSRNATSTRYRALNSYVCNSCLIRAPGSFGLLLKHQSRHESSVSAAAPAPSESLTQSIENGTISSASANLGSTHENTSADPENLDKSLKDTPDSASKDAANATTGEKSATEKSKSKTKTKTKPQVKLSSKAKSKAKSEAEQAKNATSEETNEAGEEEKSAANPEVKLTSKAKARAKSRAKVKNTTSEETNEAGEKEKGAAKPKKTRTASKSPLHEFVRKHGSDDAARKFEEFLDSQSEAEMKVQKDLSARRQLIALLQSDKLSPKSREVAMRHLRETLVMKPDTAPNNTLDYLDNSAPDTLAGKLKAYTSVKDALKTSLARPSSRRSREVGDTENDPDLSSDKIFQLRGLQPKEPIDIKSVNSADLELVPVVKQQPDVPKLSYGLERVLFNPGVYQLRDPRSRVFNFDPYLQSIMPVSEFDFNALKEYITSSRDDTLLATAKAEDRRYTGSTSSMTSALAHFHFLLSAWRPISVDSLSKNFPADPRTFTALQRSPSAIFLRWKDGTYAIDADKEFDTANILSMLGKSMEKLLTLNTSEFERYRKVNSDQISEEERNEVEAYHYTTMGDFLMRSQLDAYDPRIPGTGMFDLKTRAVVSIRMDTQNYEEGMGYEIRGRHGEFESYEREYFDMIRSAFLKYSLQVRMGRMDGIFVAFHNTERIFGFQYISLPEMDAALHGTDDVTTGDQEFKLSLDLLNRVLDRAIERYPKQSIRLHFETRAAKTPFMYIFAEPVTEEEIKNIQEANKAKIEAFEKRVLGLHVEPTVEELAEKERQVAAESEKQRCDEWEKLQANVKETMEIDGFDINDQSRNGAFMDTSQNTSHSEGDSVGAVFLDNATDDVLEDDGDEEEGEAEEVDSGEEGEEQDDDSEEKDDEKDEDDEVDEAEDDTDGQGKENNVEDQDEVIEDNQTSSGQGLSASGDDAGVTDGASFVPETSDNGLEEENQEKFQEKEILCMTLTIRNQVNDKYVPRPEDLTPNDNWTVEYSLAEVKDVERSRALYLATQKRRKNALDKGRDDDETTLSPYLQQLRQLSQKGKQWRMEQNKIDESEPFKVLDTAPLSYGDDGRPSESS